MLRRRGLLLRAKRAAAQAPANPIRWLHFRSTEAGAAGYPGDGPDATYMLATDRYSAGTPTRNGWEFGNATNASATDVNHYPPHYSGNHAWTADGMHVQLLLPAGLGAYRIWVAVGHPSASLTQSVRLMEGGLSGSVIKDVPSTALAAGQYMDAQGSVFADAAAHLAGGAYFEHTFASSALLGVRRNGSTRTDAAWLAWQKQS